MSVPPNARRVEVRGRQATLRQFMAIIAVIAIFAASFVDIKVFWVLYLTIHIAFPLRLFWCFLCSGLSNRYWPKPQRVSHPGDLSGWLANALGRSALLGGAIVYLRVWEPEWLWGTWANRFLEVATMFEVFALMGLAFLWSLAMIRKHL